MYISFSLAIQVYLRDAVGLVPDYRIKASHKCFGFLIHVKFMLTLLSVQQHYILKKHNVYLNFKVFYCLKMCSPLSECSVSNNLFARGGSYIDAEGC